jgi:hypothetical protein
MRGGTGSRVKPALRGAPLPDHPGVLNNPFDRQVPARQSTRNAVQIARPVKREEQWNFARTRSARIG